MGSNIWGPSLEGGLTINWCTVLNRVPNQREYSSTGHHIPDYSYKRVRVSQCQQHTHSMTHSLPPVSPPPPQSPSQAPTPTTHTPEAWPLCPADSLCCWLFHYRYHSLTLLSLYHVGTFFIAEGQASWGICLQLKNPSLQKNPTSLHL